MGSYARWLIVSRSLGNNLKNVLHFSPNRSSSYFQTKVVSLEFKMLNARLRKAMLKQS